MRELARPCLDDDNDDCHHDDCHHDDCHHHNGGDDDDCHHDDPGEDDHLPCSLTIEAMAPGWIGC